ncbi:MAG: putative glycoside hydrolase [Spirochaetes bacterium]|nr:putative glycoside hydrolase [Spirochaetota bacterium]
MKLFIKIDKILKIIFLLFLLYMIIFLLTCTSYIYPNKDIFNKTSKLNFREKNYNSINIPNDDYILNFYNNSELKNSSFYEIPKLVNYSSSEIKTPIYILDENLTKVYKIENNEKTEIFSVNINYEYIVKFKPNIITTSKNIYLLNENDKNYYPIQLNGLNKNATLKCAELFCYNNKKFIFIGTSHHGLYYKEINSPKFLQINKNIARVPFTSKSTSYFETISEIVQYKNILIISYKYSTRIGFLSFNQNGEIIVNNFLYDIKLNKQFINLNPEINKIKDDDNHHFDNIYQEKIESLESMEINNNTLKFETNKNIYYFTIEVFEKNSDNNYKNSKNQNFHNFEIYFNNLTICLQLDNKVEKEKVNEDYREDFTRGLYIPVHHLSNDEKILKKINLLKSLNLNTIVVDLKDDFGFITYNSNSEYAKKIKSIKKIINLDKLLFFSKENNIKIIARVVCFRDPLLFNYENGKYAFYDKRTNSPWIGLEKERWVDPASEFVVDYLCDIIKELEEKGIEEIQFDYVRYPSDGGVSNIYSIHNKNNYSKNCVLHNFLKKAKSSLSISKLSADFYGYQCFYNITKHIGQDLFILSDFIDIIYPMYYPSHFTFGFYQENLKENETNFFIYNHGVQRAFLNAKRPILVRPWIQVFKIKVSIDYKDYIQSQIDGILSAGYNSFIFWNPAGKYDILKEIKY